MKIFLPIVRMSISKAIMLGALALGYGFGMVGAQRVAILAAWFIGICSLVLLNKNVRAKLRAAWIKNARPLWLHRIDVAVDVATALIFAWNGAVATAVIMGVASLLLLDLPNPHPDDAEVGDAADGDADHA